MGTKYTRYSCQSCGSQKNPLFCTDCTHLTCGRCTTFKEINSWYCPGCKSEAAGDHCGRCGSKTRIVNVTQKEACPNCNNISLGDPITLLSNVSSDFFSTVSKVNEVISEISDLHRKFDFFVTLVRLCRLAGLTGFPQIETQLRKCSKGLTLISDKGIIQLNQVRKEVIYSLHSINYFQELDLDHYRNAEMIIGATSKSIEQISTLIRHWIEEVDLELSKLASLADPLRHYYDLLARVSRYLPEGVYQVAAILPAIGMDIKQRGKKVKSAAYVIFTEESIVLLPDEAVANAKKVVNGIVFDYQNFESIKQQTSTLKGHQLMVKFSYGEVKISGPPGIIFAIKDYFELAISDEPITVGSSKDIIEIEADAPDKHKYKRAASKFIEIVREKLFGTPVQRYEPAQYHSMREIKDEFTKIEKSAKEIDFLAKNLQIDPDAYSSQRKSIKDALSSIRSNLAMMGGHIAEKSLLDDSDPFRTI